MHDSLRDGAGRPNGGLRTDCTADTAGGLTFDIALTSAQERWDAALLLRVSSGDAADDVRLPLFPFGQGRLRASLPSTMKLAEGRWDGYLKLGEDEPRRLRLGRQDLSALVGREPGAQRTWLGVRVPYATRQAHFSLRSWLRWPHAEAGELRVGDGGMTLRGRLYGAEVTTASCVEAHPHDPAEDPVVVPVLGEGTAFHVALAYETLPRPGVWDLWLRPSEQDTPVRISRILDDIPDKYRAIAYPSDRQGTRVATPYYTNDNDLAVRLEDPG